MKILIIKPSSFGDIIQANPVAAALKAGYPDCEIKWLVFEAWEDAVDLFPDVDGKIVWDRKAGVKEYCRVLSAVRSEKFDIVIDLQGLARTAIIARFSKAAKVIGVPGLKEFSWFFIKEVFPESRELNAVLRNLETVRYLTGKRFEPVFRLSIPEASVKDARDLLAQNGIAHDEKLVVFIPGARGAAKTWPADHYDRLAQILLKIHQVKIVALGAEGDGKYLFNHGIADLCGRTSIKMLAAIMGMAKAVIGGDTGPVHMAAAMGIPTMAIFGGSDISETAPVNGNVKLISKRLDCSPCRGRPSCKDYPCLTGIKPEEVMKTLEEILKI